MAFHCAEKAPGHVPEFRISSELTSMPRGEGDLMLTRLIVIAALISLAVSITAGQTASAPQRYARLIRAAQQALVVTTPDWNSVDGTLGRFEKVSGTWKQVGEEIAVVLGKNGLGWDGTIGAPGFSVEFVKREGDGRSPAGVFELTREFGFNATPVRTGLPYLAITPQTECVDDEKSRYYNEVVNRDDFSKPDWNSSEKMRGVPQYKNGILIGYNSASVKEAGSCIFLHIWRGPGIGTAGCTAMAEAQLRRIAQGLRETKQPILIQLPASIYKRVRDPWSLP
jgi:zinc D-Ala-D-Ala dipeptidase